MNTGHSVIYLAPPCTDEASAKRLAQQHGAADAFSIGRRGYQVGWIAEQTSHSRKPDPQKLWHAMNPIALKQFFTSEIPAFKTHIKEAQKLSEAVLDDTPCNELFSSEPYLSRLTPKFELLAASCDEADCQEIETLDFDVMKGEDVIAENLWIKLSWLSFAEEDTSLRFRFSFGMAGYEDVAADYPRQRLAAELTEAIFPHSRIISESLALQSLLRDILAVAQLDYVERIVYFNAPQGGAQFHQDVERGHCGVVYAQMSGRTAWLALSKQQLLDEIVTFLTSEHGKAHYFSTSTPMHTRDWQTLLDIHHDREKLSLFLDEHDNEPLEHLINRVPAFTQQLINKGHAFILNPGDAILLPQQDKNNCCWHSVFCLDTYPGQALSFAIRARP